MASTQKTCAEYQAELDVLLQRFNALMLDTWQAIDAGKDILESIKDTISQPVLQQLEQAQEDNDAAAIVIWEACFDKVEESWTGEPTLKLLAAEKTLLAVWCTEVNQARERILVKTQPSEFDVRSMQKLADTTQQRIQQYESRIEKNTFKFYQFTFDEAWPEVAWCLVTFPIQVQKWIKTVQAARPERLALVQELNKQWQRLQVLTDQQRQGLLKWTDVRNAQVAFYDLRHKIALRKLLYDPELQLLLNKIEFILYQLQQTKLQGWYEVPMRGGNTPLPAPSGWKYAIRERPQLFQTFIIQQLNLDPRLRATNTCVSTLKLLYMRSEKFESYAVSRIDADALAKECAGKQNIVLPLLVAEPVGITGQYLYTQTGIVWINISRKMVVLASRRPSKTLNIGKDVLAALPLPYRSYPFIQLGDDLTIVGNMTRLYLWMLNPGKTEDGILQHLKERCGFSSSDKWEENCEYLRDFERYVQHQFFLPPFRDAPLADTLSKETHGKFFKMPLFLEHVAYKYSRVPVCFMKNVGFEHIVVLVEPALVTKYGTVPKDQLPVWLHDYERQSSVYGDLLQQIDACDARLFIVPISLRWLLPEFSRMRKSGGNGSVLPETDPEKTIARHQNLLMFDNKRLRMYHYEPHGPPHSQEQEHRREWTKNLLQTLILNKLNRKYEYVSDPEICPNLRLGIQTYETRDDLGPGGYCVAWSALYMTLQILNPDWEVQDIQDRMLNAGGSEPITGGYSARGIAVTNYVRRFLQYMDATIPARAVPLHAYAIRQQLRRRGILPPDACEVGEINRYLYILNTSRIPRQVLWVGWMTDCGQFVRFADQFPNVGRDIPLGWVPLPMSWPETQGWTGYSRTATQEATDSKLPLGSLANPFTVSRLDGVQARNEQLDLIEHAKSMPKTCPEVENTYEYKLVRVHIDATTKTIDVAWNVCNEIFIVFPRLALSRFAKPIPESMLVKDDGTTNWLAYANNIEKQLQQRQRDVYPRDTTGKGTLELPYIISKKVAHREISNAMPL